MNTRQFNVKWASPQAMLRFLYRRFAGALAASVALTLLTQGPLFAWDPYLYVGNNVPRVNALGTLMGMSSSVLRFDARTGAFVDTFVPVGQGGAFGLRGLLFDSNQDLIAIDQNVGQPSNGEVLRYSGSDGEFLGNVVAESNSPYAPRGAVLSPDGASIYIADMGDFSPFCESLPGGIFRYDFATGTLMETLAAPTSFGDFHPRGLVFGSDGLLYATDFGNPCNPWSGSIVRFNVENGQFVDTFVSADRHDLEWPEGIVFGPDGDLFTVSGRRNDRPGQIMRYDGHSGALEDQIDLSEIDAPISATAQALLFGPEGKLYVPIENRRLSDLQAGVEKVVSGELRRYDVEKGTYETLIAAGERLTDPWYLTFDRTDPSTLAYIATGEVSGDFDHDTQLTGADLDLLMTAIQSHETNPSYDLNDDGRIDLADRTHWVTDLKRTWFGDANLDGRFDSSDLIAVFTVGQYEDSTAGNSGWAQGDWDGDGDFQSSDLVAAFADGGYDLGPKAEAIPEPGALTVTAIASAIIVSLARRKSWHKD